jgi:regulator of nucleoside diphosphate kinase
MNSRFVLKYVSTGEWGRYALVYPEEEATYQGRISVLSPMGMALLGAHVGEEVCWTSSAGPEVAKVQRLLYQPEAAMRSDRDGPAAPLNRAVAIGRN